MVDQRYHILLADALRGRRVSGNASELCFYGSDAGISAGYVYGRRLYQICFDLDAAGRIAATGVCVTGDLISPCSGYAQEYLDEMDYPYVLNYCISQTES